MSNHRKYLSRCYQLARLAGREVGTNPHVGAVIVHNDRIIGEGNYQIYGESHAEVNALASVSHENRKLISKATLYVSLEPCCVHGKTPPCTDAVKKSGIREVHVGTQDPFPGIAGNGIKLLKSAGIKVLDHNDEEAKRLIAPFVTYHIKQRPYITLKFAKSKDNYLSKKGEQTWLSNQYSSVITHKMRSNSDAILIGTNTAIIDNPSLTTRNFPGSSPIRMVIDLQHRVPNSHNIFYDGLKTVIFSESEINLPQYVEQVIIKEGADVITEVLGYCHKNSLVKLMVEGGATLLKSFVTTNLWDDAHVIETQNILNDGFKAPNLHGKLVSKTELASDVIVHVENISK